MNEECWKSGLFLPGNACYRASFYGLINALFIASFGLNDTSYLCLFIKLKHIRAELNATFASSALFFVNDYFFSYSSFSPFGIDLPPDGTM